jgi:D-alanyl-D-alanine carboxypeptidase (penicillin-binding protein 5/6)
MMTALVALAHAKLGDRVVLTASDLSVESFVGLTAGELWEIEDLLYALLLSSDNAAALALARHVAGSEAGFVQLMNEQARRWGLENTHFANPHGLDDPHHYSTAYDLAQIALRGLTDPVFASIVSTRQRQVGHRTLVNLNQLLGTYEGAVGIKTGTTPAAGQCLVSVVTRPDGHVLCVVLGSTDRYEDARLLLDSYFHNYVSFSLDLGPKGLNTISRRDGGEAVLVLEREERVLLPRWQLPWLRVQRVLAPARASDAGGLAGSARFTVRGALLADIALYEVAP